ncbi:MAG TPA: hypothetical protein ENO23_03305, partial [Alphaproteobacteria bacterium]|nr:hypothetical protein [Alphaproteobacteria bacterium]
MKLSTPRPRTRSIRTAANALAVLAFALPAAAEPPSVAGMVYDVAIERPIGLAETVVGVGIAGIAWPIALGTGETDVVVERCIAEPGRYTFTRSIGDFEPRPENACSPVGFSWGLVQLSFGLIERPLGLLFGRSPFADDPR